LAISARDETRRLDDDEGFILGRVREALKDKRCHRAKGRPRTTAPGKEGETVFQAILIAPHNADNIARYVISMYMPAVATYGRRSLVELAIESLPESHTHTEATDLPLPSRGGGRREASFLSGKNIVPGGGGTIPHARFVPCVMVEHVPIAINENQLRS